MRHPSATGGMATPLVPLHIAAHAEGLPASCVRALERFFPRVRVAVDFQARRPAERFAAGGADISIWGLWELRL